MEAVNRQDEPFRQREALVRVSALLRCLGLPADRAEEQANAVVARSASQADAAAEGVAGRALAEVRSEFEAWLAYLGEASCDGAPCCPGLLAAHLRPVLRENPDLFLRRDNLPEPLRLAVKAASVAPLPEESPAAMPAQPLGGLPPLLRGSFWRGVGEPFVAVRRSLKDWIRGR